MSKEDLVSISDRTTEEQQRICSAGGKASGAARRRKRTMKDAAKLILSMSVQDLDTIEALKKSGIPDPEGMNNLEAMVAVAVAKAKAGDLKMMKFIRDLLGENPQWQAYNERTKAIASAEQNTAQVVDDWVAALQELQE